MLKKICNYTFVLILILSFLYVTGTSAETIKPEEAVINAFNESHANFEEVNVNSYVILEGKYMSIDKIKKICNDIAERLNFKKVEVDKTIEEGLSQIIIKGQLEEEIYAVLIVQSSQYEEFKESTIVLDIIDTKGEYDFSELSDRIRNILSYYGKTTVNITLTGSYDNRLTKKDIDQSISRIMKRIKAKEIEGIRNEDLTSITGYCPSMIEHLNYAGKKANINIAYRYNSFEDKTNIWIGTPIIVMEY